MHALANPARFLRIARPTTLWLFLVGAVLTVGGMAAFLLGSAMLYNTPEGAPYLSLAPQTIALTTLVLVIFFGGLLGAVMRTHRRRSIIGQDSLLGRRGEVRAALDPAGLVFVAGELWSARTVEAPVPVGVEVEILAVDGLCLLVRPVAEPAAAVATAAPTAPEASK